MRHPQMLVEDFHLMEQVRQQKVGELAVLLDQEVLLLLRLQRTEAPQNLVEGKGLVSEERAGVRPIQDSASDFLRRPD